METETYTKKEDLLLAEEIERSGVEPSPGTHASCGPDGGVASWLTFSLFAVAGFSLVVHCSLPWAYRLGLIELEGRRTSRSYVYSSRL